MTLFKALITNVVLILFDSNTFDCSDLLVSLKDKKSFDPAHRSKGKNLLGYYYVKIAKPKKSEYSLKENCFILTNF